MNPNPFAVLGLEPRMDLPQTDLEEVYLRLSRETHPDAHPGASPQQQVSILTRSAEINDAHKVLADPWERARAILELREPGIMAQTKQLDPEFLMAAMEQAEAVSRAAPTASAARGALRESLEAAVRACLADITELIQNDQNRTAAVRLHQARYHKKALSDLLDPEAMQ